jgi:type IV pilus assembly protein PilY1
MKWLNLNTVAVATALTALSMFDPTAALAQSIPISETPLFSTTQEAPLNMLVVGRDHKLFNAAYNDASDLNGDGTIDVGYKGYLAANAGGITYYGYFDSGKCYSYDGAKFTPTGTTASKKCPGAWSGDFLNYVTTSRMDALRKVLYGGYRSTDTTTQTILERAYIPQDGHVFGKEYQSVARDGYDIHDYTPYSAPSANRYILFANETSISAVAASGTLRNPTSPPLLRVMQNSPFRIWNWVAIEGPVGGRDCFNSANQRVDCIAGSADPAPPHTDPQNAADFQALKNNYARSDNRFGGDTKPTISTVAGSSNNNPFQTDPDDNYLTIMTGTITVNGADNGNYNFAIDGDDAVELWIDGAVRVGWYGGHGDCGAMPGAATCLTSHSTGNINLSSGVHTFEFRHEEQAGGDNFRFYWKPPWATATWVIVPARTGNGSKLSGITAPAGVTRDFYDLTKPPTTAGVASITDLTVRVEVCKSVALNEDNCEKYTNPVGGAIAYKPTGLLHQYGETDKMLFGLMSGSFMHNKQGGTLRKQMGTFRDEINMSTGQFASPKKGIIATLDGIKIQSLNMSGTATCADGVARAECVNPNYGYNCSAGWSSNQPDGQCRPWGNPIGEMMFESLRYFGGAAAPEPEYTYTNTGSDDLTLGMPEVTAWKDPYKSVAAGGLGNLSCAKPFDTVISDVNPSFDSELPGNAFAASAPTGSVPTKLAALDVNAQGQAIWTDEGYGTKNIYIGQSGSNFDAAPTAKSASSFGNIRGLSPEEPTKQGTYYSASVAFYGRTHDLSDAVGDQKLDTFSVALSSPLPRIEFPINGHTITLVPFAKSIAGCIGVTPSDAFIPTNQIVGFYVETMVNVPGQPHDGTINGGRPYAVFRISYEDAEQGNDYDMDAIARYELTANADNSLSVHMTSEYAAGCAIQHIGYVISGSNADGVYLEVRDRDTGAGDDPRFRLDTPDGFSAGQCSVTNSNDPNASCPTAPALPLEHTRAFTVGATAPAEVLKDPLWFAAKYGGFNDANGNDKPDEGEWDTKVIGSPDNYFLVTNALGLKAQLQSAFDQIIADAQPVGSAAASGARFVVGGTLAYQATYLATDWTGDLKAFPLNDDGTLGTTASWDAAAKLVGTFGSRKIFTSQLVSSAFTGVQFDVAHLPTAMKTSIMGTLDPTIYNITDVVNYLRGDKSKETSATPTPGPYRARSSLIGDILDSNPTVQFKTGFGYQNLPATVGGTATGSASYADFVANKPSSPTVYVGANDGMLHAFDGSASSTGGNELFAYIPNAVVPKLGRLAQPSYSHTYFVDGTPTIGDVFNGSWHTLLIGATGAGGRSVFGLDVTSPAPGFFGASNVLWEFNDQLDTDMGTAIGVPSLPTIFADGNWGVAFGNGFNSARNRAELFILNAMTGVKLAELDTGIGGSNASTNCPLATGPTDCPNGLSSAVVVDTDLDGVGDTIYAGDYLGNLWKFTCSPDTLPLTAGHPSHACTSAWHVGQGGVPLIKAVDPNGLRQPITSGIYAISNPLGGTLVYFGTGKYLALTDADPASSTLVNTIYAVWDSPYNPNTTLTRADLAQQTITSYDSGTGLVGVSSSLFDYEPSFPPANGGKMGWYLDLTGPGSPTSIPGERILASPTAILGELLVNAFRPTGDLCQPGGFNTFFELDLLSGAAGLSVLPDGGGGGGVPPGTGGEDIGVGSPLGSPNPVISIPGLPSIPPIGCPASNPNCNPAPPAWCTVGMVGYPNCAPCQAGSPDYPGCLNKEICKWFDTATTATTVGNQIACRISWRQLR